MNTPMDTVKTRAVDHAGLTVLSAEEAAARLASCQVGRVSFLLDGDIEIFPVTYVMDGSAVAFQTDVGSKLSAALDRATVAFEIDGFDPARRTGWSVVVKGICEEVLDDDVLARLAATGHQPWIRRGTPLRWVRIMPYSITGRQLNPDE